MGRPHTFNITPDQEVRPVDCRYCTAWLYRLPAVLCQDNRRESRFDCSCWNSSNHRRLCGCRQQDDQESAGFRSHRRVWPYALFEFGVLCPLSFVESVFCPLLWRGQLDVSLSTSSPGFGRQIHSPQALSRENRTIWMGCVWVMVIDLPLAGIGCLFPRGHPARFPDRKAICDVVAGYDRRREPPRRCCLCSFHYPAVLFFGELPPNAVGARC